MRLPGLASLIASAGLLLSASAAAAEQCSGADAPIVTDRPSVANASLVVPLGSLQSENGVDISRRDSGAAFDGANSRLRLGVASCLELLVDLPSDITAFNRRLASGVTDVAPALKWQISPMPGTFDLSATFGAGLPSGTKAIAGPGVQPYVQLPWSLALQDGWNISGQGSVFFTPADSAAWLATETTFALGRDLSKSTFAFIEYVGDYHLTGGPAYQINSGLGYRLTPTQQIDVRAGVGLNSNAPTYVVGVGYSFRLDGLFR